MSIFVRNFDTFHGRPLEDRHISRPYKDRWSRILEFYKERGFRTRHKEGWAIKGSEAILRPRPSRVGLSLADLRVWVDCAFYALI